MRRLLIAPLVCIAFLPAGLLGQSRAADDVQVTVRRVGDYVQRYLATARTILAREVLTLEPLDRDLRLEGRARQFVYQTRVTWEPSAPDKEGSAMMHRGLVSVDGRAPRPGEDAGCLNDTSQEPLAFLLPGRREEFAFAAPGPRARESDVLAFDYAPLRPGRDPHRVGQRVVSAQYGLT